MNNNKQINNNKHNNNNDNNTQDNKLLIKITLLNEDTKEDYSTLMLIPNLKYFKEKAREIKQRAIQTICNRENKTGKELLDKGFNKIGVKIVINKRRVKL